MTSSNNNIYELKCYLNVFKIVADKMQGFGGSYAFNSDAYSCFFSFK